MSKKRAKKRSIGVKDLQPRPPIVAGRAVKAKLRGIASVVLSGFGQTGGDTSTTITPKKGKPKPDTDTSVTQDHYVR